MACASFIRKSYRIRRLYVVALVLVFTTLNAFAATHRSTPKKRCPTLYDTASDSENRFNELYTSDLSVTFNPKNKKALAHLRRKYPAMEDYLLNEFRDLNSGLDETEFLARARLIFPPRRLWLPKQPHWESLRNPAELQSQIDGGLKFVYKEYVRAGTVTESETVLLAKIDSQLAPERTSYIFFHDEKRVYFAIRIYDGSLKPFAPLTDGKLLLPSSKKSAFLPIQLEYPRLKITDRYKVEIGRTARDALSDDNLHRMFGHVAGNLSATFPKESRLMIYAECTESRLEWYVKEHGFEVFAGSKVPSGPTFENRVVDDFQLLPEMKGSEDRYIIRIPLEDFESINSDMLPPRSIKE